MGLLTRATSAWTQTQTQTSQDATYTFSTGSKYVDKDIKFNVTVPGIVLKKPAAGAANTTFTVQVEGDSTVYTWTVDSDGNIWIEQEDTLYGN